MSAEAARDFEASLTGLLVERGKLDAHALERVARLRDGAKDGHADNRGGEDSLLLVLARLGLVGERDLAESAAELLNLPLVAGKDFPALPITDGRISPRFMRQHRLLPIGEAGPAVVLAMANPLDDYAAGAVRAVLGREIERRIGVPAELEAAIDRLYGREGAKAAGAAAESGPAGDSTTELDVEKLKDLASEAPVIRLVNQLINRAAEMRASDIHLEPFESHLRVRYRIDGALREMEPIPDGLRHAVVSRLKIMARLNIAERRLPQDGRIKLAVRGMPIDLRMATAPGINGEIVALRLLDRQSVALDFAALGIAGVQRERYLGIVERPNGVVLVTGPTGSGKTTTLYTTLLRLNKTDTKILTVEDPIEYQLEGINQIQVKPSIGLTFAGVLRSFLRHDPDIIMVGEIRDVETAEIAVHAALTGHLVLSTLHTNNAASSITRLLDMGVQDYLLTSTINGVAAQRLVRTLCPACREPYRPPPELVAQLGLARFGNGSNMALYRGRGCEACGDTGYKGRTSLFETLVMSEGLRRLVLRHAEANDLHKAAADEGMRTMFEDGMLKALEGETTVEEVLRVTREA